MEIFGFRIARTKTLENEARRAVDALKWATHEESRKAFISEGYVEWVHTPPPRDRQFLMIRSGWFWPTLTSVAETSPYMNTVGAFWKLDTNSSIRPLPEMQSATIQ
jgi:hypothetical protein